MQKNEREARAAYERILEAFSRGDWSEMEATVRGFGERHAVPPWYVDEIAFQGMKLWKAERRRDLLRHFALLLDRVAGRPVCWDAEEADQLVSATAT